MMEFLQDVAEPEPLSPGAVAFRQYVTDHQLKLLDVALEAGVRYSTVWCIWKGFPVKSEHAALVRQGLWRMTGIAYTAPILVTEEPAHTTGSLMK